MFFFWVLVLLGSTACGIGINDVTARLADQVSVLVGLQILVYVVAVLASQRTVVVILLRDDASAVLAHVVSLFVGFQIAVFFVAMAAHHYGVIFRMGRIDHVAAFLAHIIAVFVHAQVLVIYAAVIAMKDNGSFATGHLRLAEECLFAARSDGFFLVGAFLLRLLVARIPVVLLEFVPGNHHDTEALDQVVRLVLVLEIARRDTVDRYDLVPGSDAGSGRGRFQNIAIVFFRYRVAGFFLSASFDHVGLGEIFWHVVGLLFSPV
mmetsp:Transcript_5324/g.15461  ORF Transcript_5324/g.15461 Transcript_5324/m.15461 type:complete len:264 (-) Transcript_5324:118-909(-)